MNIKFFGGGEGVHNNAGSCSNLIDYLQHEDLSKLLKNGQKEDFFSLESDNENSEQIKEKIDSNKGQLMKSDAKFYMVVVSPSDKEIKTLGDTPKQRSEALKDYVKNEFIQNYAENFNKNLNKEDILFFGKIHHERKDNEKENMHAHIILSRKTKDNKTKISPMTNHKNTSKGVIKGGFNRSDFFKSSEELFDKKFNHEREFTESYEYLNTMKNGTNEEKQMVTEKKLLQQNENKLENNKKVETIKSNNLNR